MAMLMCVFVSITNFETFYRFLKNWLFVVPLKGNLTLLVLISYDSNNNMAEARSCDGGATLATNFISSNDVW
jgi:hypothetical protein